MKSNNTSAIIEWESWNQFLLPYVLPDAQRITIDPFVEMDWLGKLDQFGLVCIQVNLSCMAGLPVLPLIAAAKDTLPNSVFVNHRCGDITKRRLQAVLLDNNLGTLLVESRPAEDFTVIVKTNLNHGGVIENRNFSALPLGSTCRQYICNELGPTSYQLHQLRDIPDHLLSDKRYSVERFITNRDDYFYRIYFAGKRRIAVKAYCPGPIKKISGTDQDLNFAFTCDDCDGTAKLLNASAVRIALELPRLMRADFGCIDVVVSDEGESYAVDFNTTPWAGPIRPGEDILAFLCEGLFELGDTQQSLH